MDPLTPEGGLGARLVPALEPLETLATPVPAPGDRLAAVLVPVVGCDLVFTRRTEHLPRHAGEISFPGGLAHAEDADLAATALREVYEELGVPPASVRLLGALPPVHTFVSSILVVPFVGILDGEPAWSPDAGEIAEVLRYGLEDLGAAESTVEWPRDGHVYRGFAYPMADGHTIWGVTARILHDLLEALRRGGPE
jgi:8-oxo-dGTP pyrophosphatase MutT (NUDIX family)